MGRKRKNNNGKRNFRKHRQRGGGFRDLITNGPEMVRKSLTGKRADNILRRGQQALNMAKAVQNHLRTLGPSNQRNQKGGLPFLPLAMALGSVTPFISTAINKAIDKI